MAIARLFKDRHPRRFHGECQRCQRSDYLPWATEHGVRYCGQCWGADALAYAKAVPSLSKSDARVRIRDVRMIALGTIIGCVAFPIMLVLVAWWHGAIN